MRDHTTRAPGETTPLDAPRMAFGYAFAIIGLLGAGALREATRRTDA
jgi:hypothetical protein